MDRELVLAALVCALCGPALVAGGLIPARHATTGPARSLERSAWRQLWAPVAPAALVLAFLVGWALQEPAASEATAPALLAIAAVFACVWSRAALRAVRSLRRDVHGVVAMTSGFVHPRVSIAPALMARLDPAALAAVRAHEAAHARHRDPLRLWLAQIATDLQWPSRAARHRFARWRQALELARDAEACEHVEGSDLATALIEAARLSGASPGAAIATLVTVGEGTRAFRERIHRLLDVHPEPAPPRWTWARWMPALVALVLAVVAGCLVGEDVVGLLPGIG